MGINNFNGYKVVTLLILYLAVRGSISEFLKAILIRLNCQAIRYSLYFRYKNILLKKLNKIT